MIKAIMRDWQDGEIIIPSLMKAVWNGFQILDLHLQYSYNNQKRKSSNWIKYNII